MSIMTDIKIAPDGTPGHIKEITSATGYDLKLGDILLGVS